MAKSNRQLKEGADFGADPGIRGRFAPVFLHLPGIQPDKNI